MVYLEDIIIYLNTFKEHIDHVEDHADDVLNSLKQVSTWLQIRDANYLQKTSIILGSLLSLEVLRSITLTLHL